MAFKQCWGAGLIIALLLLFSGHCLTFSIELCNETKQTGKRTIVLPLPPDKKKYIITRQKIMPVQTEMKGLEGRERTSGKRRWRQGYVGDTSEPIDLGCCSSSRADWWEITTPPRACLAVPSSPCRDTAQTVCRSLELAHH